RQTDHLVDGENIDATLGMNVQGHRPNPDERPRWDRVTEYARNLWNQPVQALFFLNATSGQMPMHFVQALLAMGYHPIPLSGSAPESVLHICIQRTLDAIKERPGPVPLASQDGDFLPQLEDLIGQDRRLGVFCFREFVSGQLTHLAERGVELYDLEDDVHAFTAPLP